MQITEQQKRDIAKKRSKVFVRQDVNKKSRLEKKWHYPKGIHSKLRHRRKGYGLIVKTGYKTPNFIRERRLDGKLIVTVKSLEELSSLANEHEVIVQFASTLGKRKRTILLNKIIELNLPYVGDAKKELETINKLLEIRKSQRQAKKSRLSKKVVSPSEKEAKVENKESENKEEVEEKVKEKKEFDKLLTKEK